MIEINIPGIYSKDTIKIQDSFFEPLLTTFPSETETETREYI